MRIPLIRTPFQYEDELKQVLTEFVNGDNKWSYGDKVKEFEARAAIEQGTRFGVMVNSGSSANLGLIQGLLELGRIKPNARVAVSALTWSTNISPLLQLIPQADILPIDCDMEGMMIRSLDNSIDVDVIWVTNQLGMSDRRIQAISQYAKQKKVLLIVDNCEGFGTLFGLTGATALTTSFYVSHTVSAVEGGMIFTNDEELYNMLKSVVSHGWMRDSDYVPPAELEEYRHSFWFPYSGMNLRSTELNAVIGLHQIQSLQSICERRTATAATFNRIMGRDSIPGAVPMFNIVRTKDPQKAFEYLKSKGIDSRPFISGLITQQPFIKKAKQVIQTQNLYCASAIAGNYILVSNDPNMTLPEFNYLVKHAVEVARV